MNLNYIINKIINRFDLYEFYYIFSAKKNKIYDGYKKEKKIYFLMEPNYGNLGDHAIAYSTELYIKENYPDYKLICINEEDTYRHLKAIKNSCNPDDMIFLQGGGNVGNLYPYIERIRRLCLYHLKNYKIVLFPFTAHFTESHEGKKELKKSIKVYKSCISLTLAAREKFSYDFMVKNFSCNNVVLTPDIVFYLLKIWKKESVCRTKITVCLRREREADITDDQRNSIIHGLLKVYPDLFMYDTTVSRMIPNELREIEVMSLLNEFCRAKLVITDRMHGMIFAAITKTPCIVFKSFDYKIVGSYDWISQLNYIKLIDNPNINDVLTAITAIENLEKLDELDYILEAFNPLRKLEVL